MKTTNITIFFVLGICSVIGCSKQLKPDGFPPLHPVSVLITQDGKPLEGAMVVLHPKDDTPKKWGIIGETDSNGKAIFVTHGKFYGAPEGEYIVTVGKEELVDIASRGENAVTDSYTLVEQQYTDKGESPLRLQIQKRGKNYVELDVGKPVRIFLERNVG